MSGGSVPDREAQPVAHLNTWDDVGVQEKQ
jgi:hypothetical protein